MDCSCQHNCKFVGLCQRTTPVHNSWFRPDILEIISFASSRSIGFSKGFPSIHPMVSAEIIIPCLTCKLTSWPFSQEMTATCSLGDEKPEEGSSISGLIISNVLKILFRSSILEGEELPRIKFCWLSMLESYFLPEETFFQEQDHRDKSF